MAGPQRPSSKELAGKLKEAKVLLCEQPGLFAEPVKAVGEFMELGIGDTAEVWPLIVKLLDEITPSAYTGGRPPQKSYEKQIEGVELFAFSWASTHLSRKMYLKFALKGGRFYYVSLHKDRPHQSRR